MDFAALRDILRPNQSIDPAARLLICAEEQRAVTDLPILAASLDAAVSSATWEEALTLQKEIEAREKLQRLCTSISSPCPVRQVPVEVLSRIFTMASFGNFLHIFAPHRRQFTRKKKKWKFTARPKPTSVTLTHVCIHWREIALQTPGAWDYTIAFFPVVIGGNKLTYESQLKRVILLYGSGRYIPSIHFNFSRMYGDHRQPEWANVISKYRGHYSSLQLSEVDFFSGLGEESGGHIGMARLQSLFLRDTPNPTNNATEKMATLHAPLLQKLTMCSPRPGFICLPIPWKQLTHFSFGNDHPSRSTNHTSRPVYARDMLKLFMEVPNLTSLVLTCLKLLETFEHIPSVRHIECIRLPKLVSLELHNPNFELLYSTSVDFLSQLYTPALEVFDLIFCATEAEEARFDTTRRCITSFLRRAPSMCQIRVVLCMGTWLEMDFVHPTTRTTRTISPKVMHFSGDAPFFSNLAWAIVEDTEDLLVTRELGRLRNLGLQVWDQDRSDVIFNHFFIGRFMERGDSYYERPIPVKQRDNLEANWDEAYMHGYYDPPSRKFIGEVFSGLLGSVEGVAGQERVVYIVGKRSSQKRVSSEF
ncbi:hypothetical protein FA13DRAFT_1344197 [Coprinellus micaceus]|uniref:F-box domain-containing protein n=1 Tax=Coprinellus micaceus TaxID=71717 RepID=A0A4Y7TNB7_COPMI|nr:hypothetical protein FA13DRAFT_1344197 [Coprinellus micaceus]